MFDIIIKVARFKMQAIHSPIALCIWLHRQDLHFHNVGALLENLESLDFIRVVCFKSEYRRISRVDTLLGSNGCLLTIVFTKKSTNLNIDYQRSQRRTTLLSFTLSTVPVIFCMKIIFQDQIYKFKAKYTSIYFQFLIAVKKRKGTNLSPLPSLLVCWSWCGSCPVSGGLSVLLL